MLPLFKKYNPSSIKEIYGQESALKELDNFIANFSKLRKKAVLLYGAIGVGKSSSAYAVANKHKLEVLEINASDLRNSEQIETKVGNAIRQKSLFSDGKLILIDDIDGISSGDRGGIQAIIKLIEATTFPIVLTAEDIYSEKLRILAKKCNIIKFDLLGYDALFNILKNICDNEGISYGENTLKALAYRSAGDARAAINDLQTLIQNKTILIESIEELFERNRRNRMINAMKIVLKTTDFKTALEAFFNVDEDIDQQILWLDENVPKEYSKAEDLARAYDVMSKADIFKARIIRWQYYRFYVYINALLSSGIAVSKDRKYEKIVDYKPTQKLIKIWMLNQKLARKKAIALKIAPKLHISTRAAVRDIMPYFQIICKNNKMVRDGIIKEFDLSDDEIEWLVK